MIFQTLIRKIRQIIRNGFWLREVGKANQALTEEPFAAFSEWNSDADKRSYADLK